MAKLGARTFRYDSRPPIAAGAAIVGPKEGEGPLGGYFDEVVDDDYLGKDTYEQAEAELMTRAAHLAMKKARMKPDELNAMLGGDLEQQILAASITARTLGAGFIGLYGACSTIAESLIVGAALVDAGQLSNALCITSSHFATAEREFRFPQELGNQRTPSAQWTVTGAGALVLDCRAKPLARVELGTVGRVIDYDVPDANHMGAAMTPAAADTLLTHFEDSGRGPSDYDLIATGDLGVIGRSLLIDLMKKRGMPLIEERYIDCGAQMFSPDQDVHAGGSGCACLASVFSAVLLGKLSARELKRILIIGTGALLSPVSALQGESIPSIAHALSIECP